MAEAKTTRREYTAEYKAEAVRLGLSVGYHEAARRLGLPVSTLTNWCRKRRAGSTHGDGLTVVGTEPVRRPVSELEAENSRLRKELADARLDVEILRKAT